MRAEGRVRRFLQLRGARGLHVVILSEDVSLERTVELRRALGPLWNAKKITFRSGIPLRIEHLERVDFQNASAIILPGADSCLWQRGDDSDMRIVRNAVVNRESAWRGENGIAVLPLLVDGNFRFHQSGYGTKSLSRRFGNFGERCFYYAMHGAKCASSGACRMCSTRFCRTGVGNEVYVRMCEAFTGFCFGDLSGAYPKAILLGIVRSPG